MLNMRDTPKNIHKFTNGLTLRETEKIGEDKTTILSLYDYATGEEKYIVSYSSDNEVYGAKVVVFSDKYFMVQSVSERRLTLFYSSDGQNLNEGDYRTSGFANSIFRLYCKENLRNMPKHKNVRPIPDEELTVVSFDTLLAVLGDVLCSLDDSLKIDILNMMRSLLEVTTIDVFEFMKITICTMINKFKETEGKSADELSAILERIELRQLQNLLSLLDIISNQVSFAENKSKVDDTIANAVENSFQRDLISKSTKPKTLIYQ